MAEREKGMPGRREGVWRGIRSLRVQLMVILSLCYLIPALLLGLYNRAVLLPSMQRRTEAAITSGAENAWSLTMGNIDRAIELIRDATYDGELTEIWRQWEEGEFGDSEFLRLSRNYLNRKYSRETMFGYAVFFPVERPELLAVAGSGKNGSAASMQALRQFAMEAGEDLDTRCRFTQWQGEMLLIRNLLDLRMERFGMLVLQVQEDQLFSAMNQLEKDMHGTATLWLDQFGEPDPDWSKLPGGLSEDENGRQLRYVRSAWEADYDFHMMLTMDRREQYREYEMYRSLTILLFLIMIPVLFLILQYVRRRIIRPVQLLSDASRRIEAGELGVTVPMRGGDELGNLGAAFSKMSIRLEELINRTYREELELKNAQILALQSRINPHFINNALEDINWQARIEGAESVSAMVTSLSVLLNAAMARDNRRLVALREEMEVADAYIFFVEQRFGNALEIRREMAGEATEASLPLMTVQPLLENAVEHGIAPAGGGMITIRARLDGPFLQLEIANTGKGITPEDRARIDAALQGSNTGEHLALANIVNRLRLIYGRDVSIEVEAGAETTVRIRIPQEQREEER